MRLEKQVYDIVLNFAKTVFKRIRMVTLEGFEQIQISRLMISGF